MLSDALNEEFYLCWRQVFENEMNPRSVFSDLSKAYFTVKAASWPPFEE